MTSDRPEGANFDAVVVGAGPAGSAAALVLARGGAKVALLERGAAPGAKNLFGGVIYPSVLAGLVPEFAATAPIQRVISRRVTMLLDGSRSTSITHENRDWIQGSPNAFSAYRPDFDAWLAKEATGAGAKLITSTTATRLVRDGSGRVCGVETDRDGGALTTKLVIAADGVNSFLAKAAGLLESGGSERYTLGVKQVLRMDPREIERRFALMSPGDGVDIEILGCTQGIPGGGFLYTNSDSIAIGVVLSVDGLAHSKLRPEEIIDALKAHPSIEPLIRSGEPLEYGAHLIPEAGHSAWGRLGENGLLVAGDAAFMCLAAGLWLEGVNYAIASGAEAGKAALAEINSNGSRDAGALYTEAITKSFVGLNHRRFRLAPELVMSPIFQRGLPRFVNTFAEQVFTVSDPLPKTGMAKAALSAARRSGIRPLAALRAAIGALRAFG